MLKYNKSKTVSFMHAKIKWFLIAIIYCSVSSSQENELNYLNIGVVTSLANKIFKRIYKSQIEIKLKVISTDEKDLLEILGR